MNERLEEITKLWKAALEGELPSADKSRLDALMSDANLMEEFSQAQASAAASEPESSLGPEAWKAVDAKVLSRFRSFSRPFYARPLNWALAALALLGAAAVTQFAKDADKPYYEEVRTELKSAAPKKKAKAPAEAKQPAARESRERELRAGYISLVLNQPSNGPASIRIFNAEGREVREVLDGVMEKGSHSFRWDGKGEDGQKVPSGSYKIEIRGSGGLKTRSVEIRPKK